MFNVLLAVLGAATLTALYLCVAYGVVAAVWIVGSHVGATADPAAMTEIALVGAAALFPVSAGLCLYWFSPGTVRDETVAVLRERYSRRAERRSDEAPTAKTERRDADSPATETGPDGTSPTGTASEATDSDDRPVPASGSPADERDDGDGEAETDGRTLVENASR
ncbi:hypothetical protein G9464_06650 [Halostella sp. JP-L12]|uniref:hypothetical protein n=1 Tax=Halostella TaxID=1843185 RepID=UPI000EF7EDA0|nr:MULTISPECIES: hypothetical protein [Halostella]NHN47277.1 hypothetical protein [Halostella sp. JP-L12]